MDKQIIFYAARHGTTVMNQQHVFRGNSDPPLDKKGFRDAHELAFYLEPIELSYIFTSDKKRTLQTSEVIRQGRNIEVVTNAGFRPWNIGDFGGMKKDDETINELQQYINNPDKEVPGGESLNSFRRRVRPLFKELYELALTLPCPPLLIAHSSVIHEIGDVFGDHHEDAHVKPGGLSAIFWDGHDVDVEPIFKADERSQTQNVLGTKPHNRAGLNS